MNTNMSVARCIRGLACLACRKKYQRGYRDEQNKSTCMSITTTCLVLVRDFELRYFILRAVLLLWADEGAIPSQQL